MNKIISVITLFLISFSLYAQSTRYDVLDETREVWVYPTVEVKIDLIFSTHGVDHFIQAELSPYTSKRNTTNLEKLEILYPDYTVRLYPVVLKHGSIDFTGKDTIKFEVEDIQASIKLTKIPFNSKEEILDQIYNNNDLLNIKIKNIKEVQGKDYSPNLDISISTFNY